MAHGSVSGRIGYGKIMQKTASAMLPWPSGPHVLQHVLLPQPPCIHVCLATFEPRLAMKEKRRKENQTKKASEPIRQAGYHWPVVFAPLSTFDRNCCSTATSAGTNKAPMPATVMAVLTTTHDGYSGCKRLPRRQRRRRDADCCAHGRYIICAISPGPSPYRVGAN